MIAQTQGYILSKDLPGDLYAEFFRALFDYGDEI